jgi:transcriptional regulator with GAF, ATPase, and Fis domain/tetratricopeptide (TPR) repeat protein
MAKRQNTVRSEEQLRAPEVRRGAVDERGRPLGGEALREWLAREVEVARSLLDKGLSSEAEACLAAVIEAATDAPTLVGQARCVLSEALEWQGRYNEALEVVQMYETAEARVGLEVETSVQLRIRVAVGYNYTGDYPKAIALLNAALKEATEHELTGTRGAACVALSRVYRTISEYTIARDFLQKALECYRREGDWRGLGEVYMGLGLIDVYEGQHESGLANYEQALKLMGKRAAPQMLGRLYANMGGTCWFIKRPHDGIRYLEKAVHYYERTEHKANAATGYNNLGINLMLVGEWGRAHEALKRALELAFEVDQHNARVPIVLDSLGELRLLMGELEEAQSLLQRAVNLASDHGNKWYEGQARRTLGRCLLASGDDERARIEGEGALALAEQIGDRQAICETHLLLAESHLRQGHPTECAAQLQKVAEQTTESVADLAIAGAAQRVHGLLWMAQKDGARAIHHFSRSVSIFEMLGDRYSSALAHYELGMAYVALQPERATEYLSHAATVFRALGARIDLARAEEALAALGQDANSQDERREASVTAPGVAPALSPLLSPLLTMRLAEASALRGLLLRELAAIIHQEAGGQKVLVAEREEAGGFKVVAAHGYASDSEKELVAEALDRAHEGRAAERWAQTQDAAIVRLEAANAPPALVVISPRSAVNQPGGTELDSLVRVAVMGLELCAFREKARSTSGSHNQRAQREESLLSGFIHSSPAMQELVDEINKIRSSDVTVLVTGESGTGKELVARAIHTLSSRRDQSFIAFNCTAVPRELSEAYLFGYRKGAFTGAVNDSPGVLRAASGGTLFLDEIGDLPLDLQPKLLRFLQEGEIQPLGEQRPVKVDVRVIAATNCDLEKMVEERSFREDLYYRLNVIRLRVPPLRERRSEIQPLVHHYIEHYSQKFKRRDIHITPQAIDLLMVNDWPGNVRQLCNELQRIVARAEDGTLIKPQHLSRELLTLAPALQPQTGKADDDDHNTGPALHSAAPQSQSAAPSHSSLPDAIEHLERQMIADALHQHQGNVTRAARRLGLTRRGLQLKLARYEIDATTAI